MSALVAMKGLPVSRGGGKCSARRACVGPAGSRQVPRNGKPRVHVHHATSPTAPSVTTLAFQSPSSSFPAASSVLSRGKEGYCSTVVC